MPRLVAFIALLLATTGLAQAASNEAPNGAPSTVLVLDGSGSMWGQVDGVSKIVIAREVMAELVATLPAERELGLMSYGHRRKGDCADIELMIQPGTDRDAIMTAVNQINPKGKTPLSAAVIEAAEALRYTEEAATVILVSDGIETCDLDPCAVGRELEAAGIGFTAHVIGFDVTADPVAQAQLRCLAEATGGLYRDAANADELSGALEEVVVAEPVAVESRISFEAIDGEGGPVIREGLAWTITTAEGTQLEGGTEPTPELMLTDTSGTATVIRLADEAVAEAGFEVPREGGPQTITLTLPAFLPPASVVGPERAAAGSEISVDWTGPDQPHDKVTIVAVGDTDDPHQDYAFTSEGSPATLRIAVTPGTYEIRYVMNAGNKVLATQPISVTGVEATLEASDTVPAGAELSVGWSGPNADRDYIAIVPAGEDYRERKAYAYTGNGNPAVFAAPVGPGDYALIYVLNANGTRELARRPITVTEVGATLTAPAKAPVGSEIEVGFTTPGGERDSLILTYPDAPATQPKELDSGAARHGSPMTLRMPLDPGSYELRYMLGGRHGEIIARALVEATPASASVDGPATALAHDEIEVSFAGPAQDFDIIAIAPAGARRDGYVESARATGGSPASLSVPVEPGDYVLRYQLGGRHGEILAEHPIAVTLPEASLATPEGPIAAGEKFEVAFAGPDFRNDFLGIVPSGAPAKEVIESIRTSRGAPAELRAPKDPGNYDIVYALGSKYGPVLARVPVTVE